MTPPGQEGGAVPDPDDARRAPTGAPGATGAPRATGAPGATGAPRRRAWAVALGVALVVQLLVLYLPRVPDVGGGAPGLDKVVHAAAFAAVTLTGVRAGISAWVLAAYGLAHAGVSEALQHVLLADRTGDGADVVADVAGVVVGLVLAAVLSRRGGP
jgi:hypothetical protein